MNIKEIKVGINFGSATIHVGRLAISNQTIYFEYDQKFITNELEISPINLPLSPGVKSFKPSPFNGLAGVFNDSIADGWGHLLFDRLLRQQGLSPKQISPLDRLANVGKHGMGALTYEPDNAPSTTEEIIFLDRLAQASLHILQGEDSEVLQELIELNGSSSGARPKALIGIDNNKKNIIHGVQDLPNNYTHWLVKFPNTIDGIYAGAIEYVYAIMAKNAGIEIPDVHLFSSSQTPGYFAIKRFDRDGNTRYHMHTAAGILHSDFRTPSLDYEDLIVLTGTLTKDVREVKKIYRLAVFNVLAHNRDDHSKNFSFLMDQNGQWKLSPAYDLTFSHGPGGEQSTMVMGEGKNPSIKHLLQLGEQAQINEKDCREIIDQTQSSLNQWPELARQYQINKSNIREISKKICP